MNGNDSDDRRPVALDWNSADEHEAAVRLNTARSAITLAAGLLILLGFAAFFVYAAVTTHGAPKRILAIVVAALLAAFAGLIVVGGVAAMSPRSLNVGPDGIRYVSSRRPWRLRWSELTAAGVEVGYHLVDRGSLLPKRGRRTYAVRLVMETTPDCTPDKMLKRFRGRWGATHDGYGFPLGPQREVVAPLDAALREHGGDRYRAVRDLGDLRGQFL